MDLAERLLLAVLIALVVWAFALPWIYDGPDAQERPRHGWGPDDEQPIDLTLTDRGWRWER